MQKGYANIAVLVVLIIISLLSFVYLKNNKINLATSHILSQSFASENKTQATSSPNASPLTTPSPKPVSTEQQRSKVLLLIYNPVLENQGGAKLSVFKGWANPDTLTQSFIESVKKASQRNLTYEVVSRIEIDGYPIKEDGFTYNDDSYLACISDSQNCHSPDLANYRKMIETSGACDKRNNGEIDELWIWGGPYFGYWESNLAGPNAFWYNSSPTTGTACNKLLPIMGFNYERGEAEMFEDLGHRLESTMTKVFGYWWADESNAWNRFALLDFDRPGRGGCGNAHLAVNASGNTGYDRTNSRTVSSSCEDFLNYPNLTGAFSQVSCSNWGCTTLGYFKWWFSHVPHANGTSDGKLNNWWKYIANPDLAL